MIFCGDTRNAQVSYPKKYRKKQNVTCKVYICRISLFNWYHCTSSLFQFCQRRASSFMTPWLLRRTKAQRWRGERVNGLEALWRHRNRTESASAELTRYVRQSISGNDKISLTVSVELTRCFKQLVSMLTIMYVICRVSRTDKVILRS